MLERTHRSFDLNRDLHKEPLTMDEEITNYLAELEFQLHAITREISRIRVRLADTDHQRRAEQGDMNFFTALRNEDDWQPNLNNAQNEFRGTN